MCSIGQHIGSQQVVDQSTMGWAKNPEDIHNRENGAQQRNDAKNAWDQFAAECFQQPCRPPCCGVPDRQSADFLADAFAFAVEHDGHDQQNQRGDHQDDATGSEEGADSSARCLTEAEVEQGVTGQGDDGYNQSVQNASTESVQGTGSDHACPAGRCV